MTLASGVRLGPYEVLTALGAGGMGEVYRAHDARLDRTVAIKVLPKHHTADPERRARFEREARAISKLNHPHICTLHTVDGRGLIGLTGDQHGPSTEIRVVLGWFRELEAAVAGASSENRR